jgi:predicted CDP-diglyceride synthetase/phosphatidate cytidylyltransferase
MTMYVISAHLTTPLNASFLLLFLANILPLSELTNNIKMRNSNDLGLVFMYFHLKNYQKLRDYEHYI